MSNPETNGSGFALEGFGAGASLSVERKQAQSSPSSFINLFQSQRLAPWLCLTWIPSVQAKSSAPLPPIISSFSLDPVSLITLFFDEPEKELLNKSGDLTILSGLGLFVNPTTLWNEYKTLLPGQGLEYYNPGMKIKSSIENSQVNAFLIALANSLRDEGVIVDLYPINIRRTWWPEKPSWEWWLLRPLMLIILVVIAGTSKDFWGIGATAALLLGQTIAISKSISDRRSLPNEDGGNKKTASDRPDVLKQSASGEEGDLPHHRLLKESYPPKEGDVSEENDPPSEGHSSKDDLPKESLPHKKGNMETTQSNIFFLNNNVTIIVRCRGELFRNATSHLTSRRKDPVLVRIVTTITFLLGILFVGFTTLNFKITYLIAHSIQATLIAWASREPIEKSVIINSTKWVQTQKTTDVNLGISRRKEAYVWVCKTLGFQNKHDTDWLEQWDLATGPTLDYVNDELGNANCKYNQYVTPERTDSEIV